LDFCAISLLPRPSFAPLVRAATSTQKSRRDHARRHRQERRNDQRDAADAPHQRATISIEPSLRRVTDSD
jgi:hypothetical protein